jgi:hypothetical protein
LAAGKKTGILILLPPLLNEKITAFGKVYSVKAVFG